LILKLLYQARHDLSSILTYPFLILPISFTIALSYFSLFYRYKLIENLF